MRRCRLFFGLRLVAGARDEAAWGRLGCWVGRCPPPPPAASVALNLPHGYFFIFDTFVVMPFVLFDALSCIIPFCKYAYQASIVCYYVN